MSKSELMGKPDELAEKLKRVKEEMSGTLKNDVAKTVTIIDRSISPKLFVTGRIDRKKEKYIAKSLVISAKLEDEIKVYCRGVDLVILNYLIKAGLEHVKQSSSPINIDIEDI